MPRHDTINANYIIFKLLRCHCIIVQVAFDDHIDVHTIKTIPITLTSYQYNIAIREETHVDGSILTIANTL